MEDHSEYFGGEGTALDIDKRTVSNLASSNVTVSMLVMHTGVCLTTNATVDKTVKLFCNFPIHKCNYLVLSLQAFRSLCTQKDL